MSIKKAAVIFFLLVIILFSYYIFNSLKKANELPVNAFNQGVQNSPSQPEDYSQNKPLQNKVDESSLKDRLINPIDSAEMILIPEGEFIMGADDHDPLADEWEKPQRRVYLDSYYIYKHEVTNDQFSAFIKSTGYIADGNWDKWMTSATGNYPVVMVSWNDAQAYCQWAGVNLPTEAQWEKAARGTDGRIYPWGNQWDPSLCSNMDTPEEILQGQVRALYENAGIMPAGSFPKGASPYGVMDMAGNVQEWCRDWFDENYYLSSPLANPMGPSQGEDKVLRGGSFYQEVKTCRTTHREDNFPSSNDTDYGFRCVWEPHMPFPSRSEKKSRNLSLSSSDKTDKGVYVEKTKLNIDKLMETKINPIDDAELIYIPAGEFLMGASPDDLDARWVEKPQHKVILSPYFIYKYEVTYEQFNRFAEAVGYESEGEWRDYLSEETLNHPVVYVTWNDAANYSRWAGGELPTEAQWEYAALGNDDRIFPWGNHWDDNYSNGFQLNDEEKLKLRYIYYDDMGTTPVGSFETDVSFFGVMDIGGNVIEWCRDWFDPHYYSRSPKTDPLGPQEGTQRVMRGGGWGQPGQISRATYRDRSRPFDVDGDFGFRCVIEIEGKIESLSK